MEVGFRDGNRIWRVSPDIYPPFKGVTTQHYLLWNRAESHVIEIHRGAPEYFWWKSAIKSRVWMLSQASQELCSTPNPSHLTRYRSIRLTTLLSRISSTTHSSSPSTISGSRGGRGRRPGIGSSGAQVSLTTLKTGCILLIEGGR